MENKKLNLDNKPKKKIQKGLRNILLNSKKRTRVSSKKKKRGKSQNKSVSRALEIKNQKVPSTKCKKSIFINKYWKY